MLTLCCFVIYSTRQFVLCLTLWQFVLVFVSPFSIAITSLGEGRANFSAFRTFVRFVLVWICRFPLPLDVWEGLRFVIVALPGLFSYLFCDCGASWTFLLPFVLVGTRSESIVDPQRTIDPVKQKRRQRYNYPTPPTRDIKGKETQPRNNWTLMKTPLAESKTDSYFPTKWPNGYPKQKAVSDTHIQRRPITKINHDRRTALERSVKSIS